MLMFDIDEDIEGEDEVTNLSTTATLSQGGQMAAMASSEDIQNMKSILESLRKQLEVKNEQLEAAVADMEKMKRVTQSLVEGGGAPNLDSETIVERSVSGCRSESEDSGYAGSYGKSLAGSKHYNACCCNIVRSVCYLTSRLNILHVCMTCKTS